MKNLIIFTEKKAFFILGFLWLCMQLSIYYYYGFITNFEGLKYQNDAQLFLDSHKLNLEHLFYSAYSLIIALSLKFHLGLAGVLFLQMIANAWALFRFFQISQKLFAKTWLSLIVGIFLIFTLQVQIWNVHLYTESLFISGVIIYCYRLLIANFSNLKDSFLLGLLFLFLSFIRPTGILLLFPSIVYFAYISKKNKLSIFKLLPWIISVVFVVSANLLYSTGQFFTFVKEAYDHSWVIWSYDGFSRNSNESSMGLIELLLYRKFYYFAMIRPYFSSFHNLLLMTFYPIYVLAIFGLIPFYKTHKGAFLFVLTFITVMSAFSILTFINWHGRFISPILPFIIIVSGFGMQYIYKRSLKN